MNNKLLDKAKMLLELQESSGNWDYDPYMHGMYNGMELILSILEEREVQYKDTPHQWLYEKGADLEVTSEQDKTQREE